MNPKQKGGEFEREICKKLSLWVSSGEKEDVFWRSAMSGGRATVAKSRGKDFSNQVGDISAIDPLGFFLLNYVAVECKHYKKLDFTSFIFHAGELYALWKKFVSSVQHTKKEPILIGRQNNRDTFLMSGQRFARVLTRGMHVVPLCIFSDTVYMFKLDDVLGHTYDEFEAVVRILGHEK